MRKLLVMILVVAMSLSVTAFAEATYTLHPGDTFVRAEVTDKDGRCAWSHIIKIQAGTHSLS